MRRFNLQFLFTVSQVKQLAPKILTTAKKLANTVGLFYASWRYNCELLLLLLLITRPLPRDGSMAEDHGAPEAGQLPTVWTRGHRETESRQRVSGAKSP